MYSKDTFIYYAKLLGLQDFGSPIRDWNHASAVKVPSQEFPNNTWLEVFT